MKHFKLFSSLLAFLLLLSCVSLAEAQKRQTRPRPAAKPLPAPAPTFDNLLSADSYKIYVEVRNVGQLISSSSVNELLEPITKLAGPPKEFRTAIKWLSTHAEPVMTSRLLLATWPTEKGIPDVLVAIEFDNPVEAAKFEPQLSEFLTGVMPPRPANEPPSKPAEGGQVQIAVENAKSTPSYFISRSGSLVLITSTKLNLKNLKPAAKPLVEDANFRVAHDRFNTEPIFLFVNVKAIEKEEEERRQKAIEERKREEANKPKRAEADTDENKPEPAEPPPSEEPPSVDTETHVGVGVPRPVAEASPTPPDPMAIAMTQLATRFFLGGSGDSKWPEAIAFAATLDASSFEVRALLVNSPAEKVAPIPFIPLLLPGPSIALESPSILPANTELFVAMSLDLPQIYSGLSKPPRTEDESPELKLQPAANNEFQSLFEPWEKKLGIKFQTDLLPLLGNEIVFSMPVKGIGITPPATATPAATTDANSMATFEVKTESSGPNPIIAISLRDKEGMRTLLPKMIDAFAFKGASMMAQVEKRDDTEIVSYGNVISYAFLGNFLVLSPDAKAVHHVVDSYLKGETLASDTNFKNFTRWQPRQLQAQVYVSPALMESYKAWATDANALFSDQARDILSRLTVIPEPVTYTLSNDGIGALHQLRIPKNLLLMAVTGISGDINPPPMLANERTTRGALYMIAGAETAIHTEKGAFASLDELISQQKIGRELLEGHGYKIYVNLVGDGFEVVAVPIEYGKTGKLSFFMNESHVLRAGDHGGGPATISDKPAQ